ncbi:MAG: AraC family transcriptional regulator [Bacillota bacterium]|nr:AraC family transcriptional regulator [Bacillota bacterium]
MKERQGFHEQALLTHPDHQGWFFLRNNTQTCVRQHWHDYLEILYLEQGSCILLVDNQHYTMTAGDLTVISAGSSHSFPDLEGCCFYVLQVKADFLCGSSSSSEWRHLIPFLQPDLSCLARCSLSEKDPIIAIFTAIEADDKGKPPGYDLNIKGLLFCLFAQLIRRGAMIYPQDRQDAWLLQKLEPAMAYVEQHFCSNIGIEQVASLCFMSKTHFSRCFHQATGKTFTAYVQHVRLYKVREKLSQTNLSIEAIASLTGFSSASHLAAVFRVQTGSSPSVWRKNNQARQNPATR